VQKHITVCGNKLVRKVVLGAAASVVSNPHPMQFASINHSNITRNHLSALTETQPIYAWTLLCFAGHIASQCMNMLLSDVARDLMLRWFQKKNLTSLHLLLWVVEPGSTFVRPSVRKTLAQVCGTCDSRDSSFGIATCCGLDGLDSIPGREKDFSSS
jgi:hypothetical protein